MSCGSWTGLIAAGAADDARREVEKLRKEVASPRSPSNFCLINGYDDIDYLLSLNKEIREFDLAH